MFKNSMTVSDIIENDNFNIECPFVIQYLNDENEITRTFISWEDKWSSKNMKDAESKEVIFMTVVNGYGTACRTAVLVMEVMEN